MSAAPIMRLMPLLWRVHHTVAYLNQNGLDECLAVGCVAVMISRHISAGL